MGYGPAKQEKEQQNQKGKKSSKDRKKNNKIRFMIEKHMDCTKISTAWMEACPASANHGSPYNSGIMVYRIEHTKHNAE